LIIAPKTATWCSRRTAEAEHELHALERAAGRAAAPRRAISNPGSSQGHGAGSYLWPARSSATGRSRRTPSRISSAGAPAYELLERTIREVFPDAMVAPGLVIAGTDSRHFEAVADQVYRFMPIRFAAEDLPRLHGTDERIAITQLADMVRFYHRLLSQAAR
jgi:acetylornithine deacetylase/succinyl-diaminopimelate desuccinylase-like protein